MLLPQAAPAAVARGLSLGLAGRCGRLPVRTLLPLVPAPGAGLLGGAGAGAQRCRRQRHQQQQQQQRVLAVAQEHGQEGARATPGKETEERPGGGGAAGSGPAGPWISASGWGGGVSGSL